MQLPAEPCRETGGDHVLDEADARGGEKVGCFVVAGPRMGPGPDGVDLQPKGLEGPAGNEDDDDEGDAVGDDGCDADPDDGDEARRDRALAHATVEEQHRDLDQTRR